MYRFYCSDWFARDLNWQDSKAVSHEQLIEEFYNSNFYVPDADNSGDGSAYFAIKGRSGETRYFHLTYQWDVDYNSEEYITNYHSFEEVAADGVSGIPVDRDWIMLRRLSSRSAGQWPPAPASLSSAGLVS